MSLVVLFALHSVCVMKSCSFDIQILMENVSMYRVHPNTHLIGPQWSPLQLCLRNSIASILFGLLQHSNNNVCLLVLVLLSQPDD